MSTHKIRIKIQEAMNPLAVNFLNIIVLTVYMVISQTFGASLSTSTAEVSKTHKLK